MIYLSTLLVIQTDNEWQNKDTMIMQITNAFWSKDGMSHRVVILIKIKSVNYI